MAVRSTQCQNRAVRSTQGGRGVSPSCMIAIIINSQTKSSLFFVLSLNNAPFRKISNTAQCARCALILWRGHSFVCIPCTMLFYTLQSIFRELRHVRAAILQSFWGGHLVTSKCGKITAAYTHKGSEKNKEYIASVDARRRRIDPAADWSILWISEVNNFL